MTLIDVPTPECYLCGRAGHLQVPASGLRLWNRGVVIQEAFPDLTADEREMLMTGIHPDCWAEITGGE